MLEIAVLIAGILAALSAAATVHSLRRADGNDTGVLSALTIALVVFAVLLSRI